MGNGGSCNRVDSKDVEKLCAKRDKPVSKKKAIRQCKDRKERSSSDTYTCGNNYKYKVYTYTHNKCVRYDEPDGDCWGKTTGDKMCGEGCDFTKFTSCNGHSRDPKAKCKRISGHPNWTKRCVTNPSCAKGNMENVGGHGKPCYTRMPRYSPNSQCGKGVVKTTTRKLYEANKYTAVGYVKNPKQSGYIKGDKHVWFSSVPSYKNLVWAGSSTQKSGKCDSLERQEKTPSCSADKFTGVASLNYGDFVGALNQGKDHALKCDYKGKYPVVDHPSKCDHQFQWPMGKIDYPPLPNGVVCIPHGGQMYLMAQGYSDEESCPRIGSHQPTGKWIEYKHAGETGVRTHDPDFRVEGVYRNWGTGGQKEKVGRRGEAKCKYPVDAIQTDEHFLEFLDRMGNDYPEINPDPDVGGWNFAASLFEKFCLKPKTGGQCQKDPKTERRHIMCMNLYRDDETGIGRACRLRWWDHLSEEQQDEVLTKYCSDNPNAPDCECLNAHRYPQYAALQEMHSVERHCWWEPCRAGLLGDNAQIVTNKMRNRDCPPVCTAIQNIADSKILDVSQMEQVIDCSKEGADEGAKISEISDELQRLIEGDINGDQEPTAGGEKDGGGMGEGGQLIEGVEDKTLFMAIGVVAFLLVASGVGVYFYTTRKTKK